MAYLIGDLARLTVTFRDLEGALVDPTTVTLTIQDPANVETTPGSIVNDSTGVYHYDLNLTAAGTWFYRWTGTGAAQAAQEGQITVDQTVLVPQPPGIGNGGFTYQFGENPAIDYPRLLISDTNEFGPDGVARGYVFADAEILMATRILAMQFQSAQFFSPPAGQNLPVSPVSYLRVAATLLDAMAANKAKLSSITQILDVKLDPSKAALYLREQAAALREVDDNGGAFMVIEQVTNGWTLTERYWNQIQRQQGT